MLIGLVVISSNCISKLIGQISLPFYAFVFTSAENTSLLPGLHLRRNAWQQSVMEILSLRERKVLKQLKKILAQPYSLAYIQLVWL